MAMINCQNCEKEISDYFSAVEMYFNIVYSKNSPSSTGGR